MRTHNLYIIPRSQAECNQLQSIVHSRNAVPDSVGACFKVGQVAMFYNSRYYTSDYRPSLSVMAQWIEQVTPNELTLRYNTL